MNTYKISDSDYQIIIKALLEQKASKVFNTILSLEKQRIEHEENTKTLQMANVELNGDK